ncbi:MAG: DUF853 family protein [Erysipelotrichaceae bacterium]|nr:DUF853 family protein [Erysipelotrichaceae bacterium]
MIKDNRILLGKADAKEVYLLPNMTNRHGLIAGATGTGKTITLEVIAEGFSELGVPVFLADVKGDIAGMCKKGNLETISGRIEKMGLEGFDVKAFPVRFFDVLQKGGHPVRASISEMGPQLLSRLMGLTEVQQGVLNIVFRIADDNGLLLSDLKDLRAMIQYVGEHNSEYTEKYGNVSKQSIGAIQRAMLQLEDDGGNIFFGEPSFDIKDWFANDYDGRGYVNILDCRELIHYPLLYSTFMLWMLSELYENLPEVGDVDKPKMVFFFDEAHLLFKDAPTALVSKIETVVKLIRSKGVGIFFISQNPTDIPDTVLAQLSNRIQHALRAYTPAELRVVKASADSFRANPAFKTSDVLSELKTGEALVSCLDEEGRPNIVERTTICPPQSGMSSIEDDRRNVIISSCELKEKYDNTVDPESAYEVLQEARAQEAEEAEAEAAAKATKKTSSKKSVGERALTNAASTLTRETAKDLVKSLTGGKKSTKSPLEKAANSVISTLGGEVGKTLTRGLFDVLKK